MNPRVVQIVFLAGLAGFFAGLARSQRTPDQNRTLVDQWTIVHIATGVLFARLGIGLSPAIAYALIYEILEQFVERSGAGEQLFGSTGPEAIGNALVDLAAFLGGYGLGKI